MVCYNQVLGVRKLFVVSDISSQLILTNQSDYRLSI